MFGLGLTVSSGALVVSKEESLRSALNARVLLDGGYMEAPGCATTAIRTNLISDQVDRNLISSLDFRIRRDGGYFGSNSCSTLR